MITPKNLLLSLFLSTPALAPGCDSSRPVAPLRDGPAECADLAASCKAPAEALGEPYVSCYKTGKAKINNACINVYYDCIDECRAAEVGLPDGGMAGGSGAAGDGDAFESAGAGGQGGAAGSPNGG
jgi:hypothetical protein